VESIQEIQRRLFLSVNEECRGVDCECFVWNPGKVTTQKVIKADEPDRKLSPLNLSLKNMAIWVAEMSHLKKVSLLRSTATSSTDANLAVFIHLKTPPVQYY